MNFYYFLIVGFVSIIIGIAQFYYQKDVNELEINFYKIRMISLVVIGFFSIIVGLIKILC